jgi:hypothetical protein
MSTDQPTATEQPWGAQPPPPAPKARWSGRKTAAAVAVAVAITAGGGAAIWAATSNDSGAQQGGPGGGGPGFGPDGGGQRMFGPAALAEALHGEFVVADGSTELLQSGEVTSINDTSVAVKSTDGYTKTYTIDSSTLRGDGIGTGDDVMVIAKKSDGVALSVTERSATAGPGGRRDQQNQPAPPSGP